MKIGIIISVVLVVVFTVTGVVLYRGFPDEPTSFSAPDKLQPITFPEGLPAVFTSANPEAPAEGLYNDAAEFVRANHRALDPNRLDTAVADSLGLLLIQAMNAGKVTTPLFDDKLPLKVGANPDVGDAIELIPAVTLARAAELDKQGNRAEATKLARATWAYGQRLFENSNRLYIRNVGLGTLMATGAQLFPMVEDQPELVTALEKWSAAINAASSRWDTKVQFVTAVKPHIGDLTNMALHEQDRSLRIESVLKLGVMKFNPGHRGNKRLIEETFAALKSDSDEQIKAATEAAIALTREEMRKIK